MAYVNFKEEIYKLNIQLNKRKNNNEDTYNYILDNKDEMFDYNPNEAYSYKKIKNKFIGKKGLLNEENFYIIFEQDILCSIFKNCSFSNVKFKDCRIIGCKFYNCNFNHGGVIFENCIFIMENDIKLPSLNKKINYSCEFYDCELYCKFKNCDLSYIIFENNIIKNTFFELTYMRNVIVNNCKLRKINISDCDLSGFKTKKCYIEDLQFDDKYSSKFDEKTFFDKMIEVKKDRAEQEGFYQTYQIIADKYKENTLNNNFGEYYYLAKRMESKCLSPFPKIANYLYRITCGYGERPFNSLFLGVFLISLFAFIYLFTGVDIDNKYIIYDLYKLSNLDFIKFIENYNEVFALSAGIFLGIGGYSSEPVQISLLISSFEMILGTVTVGIGMGAIVRKIIR